MKNAVDRAYESIRSNIFSGKYQPGCHLKEENIAKETNVSRTPVREALRRLSIEHLVEFIPNQGALVTPWRKDDIGVIVELRFEIS